MKKLLLSLLLLAAAGQIFAQRNNEIKLQLTSCCKSQNSFGDVSVGYGILPTDFEFISQFSEILNVVNFRYDGYLGRRFSIGGSLSYGWANKNSVFGTEEHTALTAMLHARYNWLNSSKITLYSRIGFGLQISSINIYHNYDNTAMYGKGGALACQITPIGMEFGKGILRFYSEVGLGQTGCLEFGLRLKL